MLVRAGRGSASMETSCARTSYTHSASRWVSGTVLRLELSSLSALEDGDG